MLKHIQSAFEWNKKWFFGSSGTVLATFFGSQTIAEKVFGCKLDLIWSLIIAFIVLLIAIMARIIYNLNSENKQLNLDNSQNQKDIEKFIHQQSAKPYDRSRGDFHIYGVNTILIKEAFSYINALRREEAITVFGTSVALKYLCERLKEAFEVGVDKKYAVSIKLFEKLNSTYANSEDQANNDLRVKIFCSDAESGKIRQVHHNKVTLLSHHTCFNYSTHEAPDLKNFYYIENDVSKDPSYRSPYLEWYPTPSGTTFEQRESNWSLPYRSELVVPILPTLSRHLPFDKDKDILGFLCIDCKQAGGFHPKYDPGMLAGVCDGIYDLVDRLVKELDAQTSTT